MKNYNLLRYVKKVIVRIKNELGVLWLSIASLHILGREVLIFPCGIGDTFIVTRLIAKDFNKKVTFVVKPSHYELLSLLELDKTINLINWNLTPKFCYLAFKKRYFELMHPAFYRRGSLMNYLGYKGINLLDLHKLMLDKEFDAQLMNIPVGFTKSTNTLLLNRYKEDIKNSVVVSTEANSTKCIDNAFWDELISSLNKKNITVFLNAKDSFKGKYINVSELSISELVCLCNLSKWLISLRNGVCDFLDLLPNIFISAIYGEGEAFQAESLVDIYGMNIIYSNQRYKDFEITKSTDYTLLIRQIIEARPGSDKLAHPSRRIFR